MNWTGYLPWLFVINIFSVLLLLLEGKCDESHRENGSSAVFFRHFLFLHVFALEPERVRQEQHAFQILCF